MFDPDDDRTIEEESLLELFRQHVKEHHGIRMGEVELRHLDAGYIEEHIQGHHTLIPVTAFKHKDISLLEAAVKYLRENEGLKNSQVAMMLGRTPSSVWITYRNASRKHPARILCAPTDIYIPTDSLTGDLSMLESVVSYLHEHDRLSFREIALLINRDERTVWTANHRAEKKLSRKTGGEAS